MDEFNQMSDFNRDVLVKVTGGEWKGLTGVVPSWLEGLHYQTVVCNGAHNAISIEWLERFGNKGDGEYVGDIRLVPDNVVPLNVVKKRAEKLLQDLLYYAGQIQTKLESDMSEDDLESTAECLSSSLKELDVLPYL